MKLWHKDHVHHDQADFDACEKGERGSNRLAISVLLAIAVFAIVADLAWNQYVYGDWRCAFAECRLEKSK